MMLGIILAAAAALLCLTLAIVVPFSSRRSWANTLFSGGMLALALESVLHGVSLSAATADRIQFWQTGAALVGSLALGLWFCFSETYTRGAISGSKDGRRFRFALGFAPFVWAVVFAADLLRVLPFSQTDPTWWIRYSFLGQILNLARLIISIWILMNLERTVRSAVGTTRWRVKFVVLGVGAIYGVRIYTCTQDLLFSGHALAFVNLESAALIVASLLIASGYFRRAFTQIDVYPSRAVLHTSVTVLLGGGYLLAVGVLAQLAGRMGGIGSFQFQAFLILLGIIALAVISLSEKIRHRLRAFISRNFQRPQHDVRKVWTGFTNATAGASDSATFCRRVTTLLSETFNALSVSLWVVDPQSDRLVLGASTQKMAENPDSGNESGLTLKNFRTLTRPFDLDSEQSGVAAELRAVSAGQFQHGGHRIAVPLRAADHWLGIAILADRVHAVPYTVEEYDLLECIGDQVGASLLNLQMASAMIATKEFEALQTVSSFFAHDLKNAASSLSLMLTNLPVHFNDPDFRADALRAIGNTVERINQLISRAAKLQAGLSLNRTETDLNVLLREAIQQFSRNNGIRWVERFERLPKVPADREQLQSVVLNLLLNAQEAVGDTGTVTVETSASEDWAEFRVSDTGGGMTPEFLRSSLFRPLQTSKKKGLGIGLFQSRMIVDAHRGKISAVSEAGVGTTFRVQLPLQ